MLGLSACDVPYADKTGKHAWYTPTFPFLRPAVDDDSSFGDGVRDGCNQSIGITGSGLLRFHDFAYDPNRGLEDPEYYAGYRLGHVNCSYYIDRDVL